MLHYVGSLVGENILDHIHKAMEPNTRIYVTLHGKTGKKVMTRARYFNTLDKRKFL